ncbi:UNVERIFIED_CONTAM: hypothetical protein GTU68_012530 [Idotea baltica]|nr:hypothetical protein [Idotea baltica]
MVPKPSSPMVFTAII